MKNKCINLRGGRVLPKEHKDKMTSTGTFSPWDPPKPLPQKPVRVIKAAAPMRARPQLAPKPQLAGQDVTYTVDNDKIKETERMQDAATELAKTGSSTIHHEESGTAQSKSNTLGVIKKSGKVKKMVNQFDKVLGPEGKQITQMPPQYSKLQNGKPAKDMNSFSLAKEMTPYKKYNKARLVSSGETQVMLAAPERLAEGSSVSAEQDDKTEKCNETLSFHKSLESNLELEAPNQPGEDDQIDNGGSLHSQQSQQFRRKLNTQRSTDWESRLQDEPLYQTYRQTVISKEIKRQTLARNVSKTSIDYNFEALDNSPERGRASPKTSQRSTSQQNTLWQDLPVVRDSGVLQKIDKEQIRLQESMFEVLTSEASYLRSLNVLIDHFMNSKELENTIIIREKKILFSNISKVKEVSESFLNDLKDRVDESILISDICDIIHCHAEHDFLVYIDYVRNQIYQEQTYSSLMEKNVAFATVICRLQELPQCQKLPLTSFLLLPFQRITRIKMLTENILKRTEEGSSREQNAIKALASVSKIIDSCNEEVGKMKQMEELIHIAKKIEFDKLKAIPIISQNRRVEKQGELSEIIQRGSMFGLKPKFTPVYLFLFTDLLLICKRSSEKYVALDYAHRSLVHVQDCSEYPQNAGMENCFYLSLLENHQGKTSERLLKAPTQSDMHRWIAAFPKPTNETNSTSDTVYEDWDCPQVQCVEAYTGQQADELTLEPTDIINVLRKTSEGWYEGIRLSDGQKGWFPGSYTDVISNEHVRMRNLRERYRVLQAARHLQKAKASDTKRKGGASY
ncbi:rho guanine nucleotide exchange factor 15 isoform X4 [Protopterus annectens]|uniref:rho guanine nucleotide exchange factor 15 isoform X4 n=1 Tax=Protopterus annectens TaxID=7888 RepID=UPI001CFB1CC6|nr:rho guanine nucleotide exchange factor 15 isoform X4 [Protopterus annectens]